MSTQHIKVSSHASVFISKNQQVMDKALNNVAINIVRLSKAQVPHDTGNLQNSNLLKRIKLCHFEVSYNESGIAPYARRWEFESPPGGGGFKKGRKSHYLSDPAEQETTPDKMHKEFQLAAKDLGVRV